VKELKSELLGSCAANARLRVTFEHRHLWLFRLMTRVPPTFVQTSTYHRTGEDWFVQTAGGKAKCTTNLAIQLNLIECRLLSQGPAPGAG
jgi:hypothetical protein